ncbi:hypothetical protein MHM92_05675 [Caballeronia zhejiangensis]|nr:hypothetical protein [Caballeronia zhejiangensis]MCG7400293.1 hypothetical protein [Caballeronia zhejiangensis]
MGIMKEAIVVVSGINRPGHRSPGRRDAGICCSLTPVRRVPTPQPKKLSEAGFDFTTAAVDVSSRASVEALVAKATALGAFYGVVRVAGVSPSQGSPKTILKVDLYGTALVLEEFGKVIVEGGSGVVIASQSGHRLPPLTTMSLPCRHRPALQPGQAGRSRTGSRSLGGAGPGGRGNVGAQLQARHKLQLAARVGHPLVGAGAGA